MKVFEKMKDLRENRFSSKIKKTELSTYLGMNHIQQYTEYEKGLVKINVDMINKLCHFFMISSDYFIDTPLEEYQCYLPFFKKYDFKKSRFSYYDLNEKKRLFSFSKNENLTDYFLCEIPSNILGEHIQWLLLSEGYVNKEPGIHKIRNTDLVAFDDVNILKGKIDAPSKLFILTKKIKGIPILSKDKSDVYLIYVDHVKEYLLARIKVTEYESGSFISVIPIISISSGVMQDFDMQFAADFFADKHWDSSFFKEGEYSIIGKVVKVFNPDDSNPKI